MELDIFNEYGAAEVKQESGKYYWTVDGYGSPGWQEIPKSLYIEIIKFAESGQAKPPKL